MSTLARASRSARRGAGALALATALALLTACGGGNDNSGSSGTTTSSSAAETSAADSGSSSSASASTSEDESITATEADFSIKLDEDTLTAGSYTIEVVNEGRATHDLVVEQNGSDVAKSDIIGPGESTTFTVDLEPGDYVFYCSIGNHRKMGMELPVTVS